MATDPRQLLPVLPQLTEERVDLLSEREQAGRAVVVDDDPVIVGLRIGNAIAAAVLGIGGKRQRHLPRVGD